MSWTFNEEVWFDSQERQRRMPSLLRSDRLWGAPTLLFSRFRELLRWGLSNRVHKTDHSPPSSAEIKMCGTTPQISHIPNMACSGISLYCYTEKRVWIYEQNKCGHDYRLVTPWASFGVEAKMRDIMFFFSPRNPGLSLQTVQWRRRPRSPHLNFQLHENLKYLKADEIPFANSSTLQLCGYKWHTSGADRIPHFGEGHGLCLEPGDNRCLRGSARVTDFTYCLELELIRIFSRPSSNRTTVNLAHLVSFCDWIRPRLTHLPRAVRRPTAPNQRPAFG